MRSTLGLRGCTNKMWITRSLEADSRLKASTLLPSNTIQVLIGQDVCMKGICTGVLSAKLRTMLWSIEVLRRRNGEERVEQLNQKRMRQQNFKDEEERMLKRREFSSSSSMRGPTEVDYCSTRAISASTPRQNRYAILFSLAHLKSLLIPVFSSYLWIREDEFDLDLEDIMGMEAI
ncbi:hypothetical protein Sango_1299300 [Sesamum angolense]|uniref:Uncharacterized protein n=1 Tax=Sesamum angolense TaxID=2727404 RepID=A0AAE2BUM8_9LAMI|nr:hypothetical protein Sango_1299300 [Sesamum angolense]